MSATTLDRWEQARLFRAMAIALPYNPWERAFALAVEELDSKTAFGSALQKMCESVRDTVSFGDLVRNHRLHFTFYVPAMMIIGETTGQLHRALLETSRILKAESDALDITSTEVGEKELWDAIDFKLISMICAGESRKIPQTVTSMADLTHSQLRSVWKIIGQNLTQHDGFLPLASAMERIGVFSQFVMTVLNAHGHGHDPAFISKGADHIAEERLARYFTLEPRPHH